jgi:beta-ureidopropionase
MGKIVKCGLIQCSNPLNDESKPVAEIQRRACRSCACRRSSRPVLLRRADPRWYDATERIPDGPTDEADAGAREEARMVIVVPLYERRCRRLLQHRRGHRRRRQLPRQVPQEPHPALRAGLLGEVLLPPGNLGYPVFQTRYARSASTSATTATSPRARAPRPQRRRDRVQPVGHGRRPVRVPVEARAARARGRQRLLRRRDQPRRHRGAVEHRRVLRPELLLRSPRAVLAEGSRDRDELVTADLDLDMIREVRNVWQFLRDARRHRPAHPHAAALHGHGGAATTSTPAPPPGWPAAPPASSTS